VRVADLGSSAASTEQKFAIAPTQASSNLPTTGAQDQFTMAIHVRVLQVISSRKALGPIAITISFGSLVLSYEDYNQGKFA